MIAVLTLLFVLCSLTRALNCVSKNAGKTLGIYQGAILLKILRIRARDNVHIFNIKRIENIFRVSIEL